MFDTRNDEHQDDIEPTGEDTIDEPDVEDIEATEQNKIKTLRAKLKACEAEKMEHLENLQRAKAEFLNSKKRLEEERLRDKERAIENQIEKLLPLCDSFDMAMKNTEAWEAIDKNWRTGVEAIYNQLKNILNDYGVGRIGAVGDTFDPNQHEAIGSRDSDDASDTVIEIVQTGYERNGSIIREAKVIVSN